MLFFSFSHHKKTLLLLLVLINIFLVALLHKDLQNLYRYLANSNSTTASLFNLNKPSGKKISSTIGRQNGLDLVSAELSDLVPIGAISHPLDSDKVVDFWAKNQSIFIATSDLSRLTSQIDIVDVSNPAEPKFRSTIPFDSQKIECIDLSDQYLLVATRDLGNDTYPREINIFLFDINENGSVTLLTQKSFAHRRCKSLRIIENSGYLMTYSAVVVFEMPSLLTINEVSRQDVQTILHLDDDPSRIALIRGACSGKWGCTTTVESAPLLDFTPENISDPKKFGGLWFANTAVKENNLFLTGIHGLSVLEFSEALPAKHICTAHSRLSTLAPFKSELHFIGKYGVYLSEYKIATTNFTDITFPIPGPTVKLGVDPAEIASADNLIYVLDKRRLTIYETIWENAKPKTRSADELVNLQATREFEEKYMCEEDEVQLVDSLEVEALLAIHKSLNGQEWRYTGQVWAGKTYRDYQQYGPWPVASVTSNEGTLSIKENTTPCNWTGVECSCDGHVIGLSFSLRNAHGDIPPEIGNLKYLEKLDLSYTGPINTLPTEMGQLKSLKRLSFLHERTVPKEVESLPEICIISSYDGSRGPGCDKLLNPEPKAGCTH